MEHEQRSDPERLAPRTVVRLTKPGVTAATAATAASIADVGTIPQVADPPPRRAEDRRARDIAVALCLTAGVLVVTGCVALVVLMSDGRLDPAPSSRQDQVAAAPDTTSLPPTKGSSAMDDFAGVWRGTVDEDDAGSTTSYDMELDLGVGDPGDLVGRSLYFLPDGDCRGEMTLVGTYEDALDLTEQVVAGECVQTGSISIVPTGTSLAFHYVATKRDGTSQNVDGTLTRYWS